jgi:hypothetical protein
MIRCVKLWTGADRKSHFEQGFIDLEPGARGDALSARIPISSFRETDVDPKLGWRADPARPLVITLSGTRTPDERFALRAGDILFTEGHERSRPQLEDGWRPALMPSRHDPRSEDGRSL